MNFTVKDNGRSNEQKYETAHELKGWADFVKIGDFEHGRDEAANLELLPKLVYSLYNDWPTLKVKELDKPLVGAYNQGYEF